MRRTDARVVLLLVLALLLLSACARRPEAPTRAEPARIEPIEGTELARVVLTPRAAERLGVVTVPVRAGGAGRLLVPYASVVYDVHGETWVYTSPEPLSFVRQHIEVERIEGDTALLSDGPAAGTEVVTVGVAELYGTEFEVGH